MNAAEHTSAYGGDSGGWLFISHTREDTPLALRLAQALEGLGYRTWLAGNRLQPWDNQLAKIGEAIERAEAVVALVTPHATRSERVRLELQQALVSNRYTVPVFAGGAFEDSESILPWIYSHVRHVELTSPAEDAQFATAADEVRKAIVEFETAPPMP